MSDFSSLPHDELTRNLQKGYVGLYFEQGVPILDRDLNLLQDLIATSVRSIVRRYIGNGVSAGDYGFEVAAIPADNNFSILIGGPPPGTCLVGGIEVSIEKDTDYAGQGPVPLTTPTVTADNHPRLDTVYLDVWLETVDGGHDDRLLNAHDVGIQTSVRLRPGWIVKVAEDATTPPSADPGHTQFVLARLARPRGVAGITSDMITDLRQTRLALDAVERRTSILEQLVISPALRRAGAQFEPGRAGPGGTVTIRGRNLDLEPVTVHFGAFPADVTAMEPTQLVAVVPQNAGGRVRITIRTAGGTVVSDDLFQVIGSGTPPSFAAPPNEFDPRSGDAGVEVTLHGTNFDNEPVTVDFGGFPADVSNRSATQIVTKVPARVTGPVPITVHTGVNSVSSMDSFAAGPPPGFAPANSVPGPIQPLRAGVGGAVTLTGTNFNVPPTTVEFGTVPAVVASVSDTEIKTTVPVGATGRLKIRVTNGTGASTVSDQDFNVIGGG